MAEKNIGRCPSCNKYTWLGAEFCHQCGFPLRSKPDDTGQSETARVIHPQPGRPCVSCGNAIKPGFKFCGVCGEPVAETPSPADISRCSNCGVEIYKGTRFCSGCGKEVLAERPPEKACAKCGAICDSGIVFCADCGERFPVPIDPVEVAAKEADKAEAVELSVVRMERMITVAVASPKIIAIIAAVLLVFSCFLPWLDRQVFNDPGVFGNSLPAYLIIANILIAMAAVLLASWRRPVWGLFLLMGLVVFTIEFVYLYGLQEKAGFTWDVTLSYLNYISSGFVLHLIAGILLFINIYFARLRRQIEFERYVKTHSRWQF